VEKDWRIRTAPDAGSIPQAINRRHVLVRLGVIAKYAGIFTILATRCVQLSWLLVAVRTEKKNLPLTAYYSSQFSSLLVLRPAFLSAVVLVVIVCDWFI
jgi:hypothetical protein